MKFDTRDMTLDVTDLGGTWIDLDVVARKARVDEKTLVEAMLPTTSSDAVRRQLMVAATNVISDAVALGADEDVIDTCSNEALASYNQEGRRFDAALFVHEGSPAVTATECSSLMCMLDGTRAIPVTFNATRNDSFATGFVLEEHAGNVDEIGRAIALILDDPTMRTYDDIYDIADGLVALLR